jgi:hypothetical protein
MPLVLWIGAMSFEGPLATVHSAFVVMSFVGPLDYVCSAAMTLCPSLGPPCVTRTCTTGMSSPFPVALLKRQPV